MSVSLVARSAAAILILLAVTAAVRASASEEMSLDCDQSLTAVRAIAGEGALTIELSEGPGSGRYAIADIGAIPGAPAGEHAFSAGGLLDLETGTTAAADLQGSAVQVLGLADWRSIRAVFLDGLLAPGSRDAIAVSFPRDDYLLYFDESGDFRVDPLRFAPEGYRVRGIVSLPDLLKRGVDAVRRGLGGGADLPPRLLLTTGHTGRGALPFVYADLESGRFAFLRCPVGEEERRRRGKFLQVTQTLWHLARSHLIDLLPRPVSSVHRAVFVLTEAAADTLRPDWPMLLAGREPSALTGGPGMDLDAFEAELDRITGRRATTGTAEFLIDGEPFFSRLIEAILSARESIRLRVYIFDDDDYAKEIADLLKQRSREGIDVKVLMDGLGSLSATLEDPDTLPVAHEPPVSVLSYLKSDSKVKVRKVPNIFLTGDHVKTILIDDHTAFTGGMNIGREYRYEWHDLMAELSGPVVDTLRNDFDLAWAHAGWSGDLGYVVQKAKPNRRLADPGGYPLRVIYTRAARSEIFAAQLAAIRRARDYIYIENAYFTDDTLLFELLAARHRGVDVRVIMPLETDRGLITRDNALAANVMMENGIRVFVYPGMSHVKAAVYDGWACFGSANFDRLSLRINKEINIATSHPEAVQRLLDELFVPDFARSRELEEPFPERWLDHLMERFGDYLF